MEETSSVGKRSAAKKRPEVASQPLVEEPANKKKKEDKIVVKYVEDNAWEQEIWRNYYVFDYNAELVKQFHFLNAFLKVFDVNSKIHYDSLKGGMRNKRRTTYSLTMLRSAKVDEAALKRDFCTTATYKGCNCYSFDGGIELPHYREVQEFCKKHAIDSIASMKQNLPKVLLGAGGAEVETIFYKSFGDYDKKYGDGKLMFKETRAARSSENESVNLMDILDWFHNDR
jgi:hypothetical protein